eukprot:1832915-Pleurochrysis_carterae.AAC.1
MRACAWQHLRSCYGCVHARLSTLHTRAASECAEAHASVNKHALASKRVGQTCCESERLERACVRAYVRARVSVRVRERARACVFVCARASSAMMTKKHSIHRAKKATAGTESPRSAGRCRRAARRRPACTLNYIQNAAAL